MNTFRPFPWRSLSVFILLAAAINLPISYQFVQPFTARPSTIIINEIGPIAATLPWPLSFPTDEPWPQPHQWSKEADFGFVMIAAWGVDGTQTTHQVVHYRYGWPIASFDRRVRHWPAEVPSPATDSNGLRLRWRGVVLNPILVGSIAWIIIALIPWTVLVLRHRRRLRRNHCPRCNYNLTASPTTCPECGWTRTPK